MMMKYLAKIVSFEEFNNEFRDNKDLIVATSGGFDPVHPGHLACIYESSKLGNTTIVIVNGDSFLCKKKGYPFMDLKTRCEIISYISGVDYVIPFDATDPEDLTVNEALARLRPHIFTKGGDRIDASTIPEFEFCLNNNIQIITGVGGEKSHSSSDFLSNWKNLNKS